MRGDWARLTRSRKLCSTISRWPVAIAILQIEWMSQRHYFESIKD
jgi:hypothetical protein